MERIVLAPGEVVNAAAEGRQLFVGGGPGTVVRMNGNPADYAFEPDPDDNTGRFALLALNGTGVFQFDNTIERIGFVSGAYALVRNLPAVIAAGSRVEQRGGAAPPFRSYAQIREDVLLMRALRGVDPQDGFYVDVGAYDPDIDSVTRTFYEAGWRGINLEPSPALHAAFTLKRPRDVNLCSAASATRGQMKFYGNDGEQLGTLEARFADPAAQATAIDVPVVRLADVFEAHVTGAIHFLKIDVEGHERDVLEGCDFDRFRPWIVVMEAVAPNRADVSTFGEWEDLLIDARYRLVAEDELNRYYLAEEHAALAGVFALPVDNYVTGRLAEEAQRLAERVEELEARLGALRTITGAARTLSAAIAARVKGLFRSGK